MPTDGRRTRRVADAVQAHLAEALRRDLGDPALSTLVVTVVELSDDLGIAHVGVRLLGADEDPKARRVALRRIEGAARRLRRGLGARLGLRRVPELRFRYDAGHDAERRVAELLDEIERG